MKVESRGDTVIAFTSADTATWTEESRTLLPTLGHDKTAGIMVCSNSFEVLDTMAVGHFATSDDSGSTSAGQPPSVARVHRHGRRPTLVSPFSRFHVSRSQQAFTITGRKVHPTTNSGVRANAILVRQAADHH
jgi:hypothetical protein